MGCIILFGRSGFLGLLALIAFLNRSWMGAETTFLAAVLILIPALAFLASLLAGLVRALRAARA